MLGDAGAPAEGRRRESSGGNGQGLLRPVEDLGAEHRCLHEIDDGGLVTQQNLVDEQVVSVDHRGVRVQPAGHGECLPGLLHRNG